ncbi:MAG: class I SAM-dependent methyltransferase [Phycisphaerales bacterium]
MLRRLAEPGPGKRVLDVGCGNGYNVGQYLAWGCSAGVGVDVSDVGIGIARRTYPAARFEVLEIAPDVPARLGESPFDIVSSTEVVEHLYDPHAWARCCFNALAPGGRLVCSTPYHGYVKNLAISLAGGWDRHWEALREGQHIKFFSRSTLRRLLADVGFVNMVFAGAGRVPLLWKSMLVRAERPR